MGVGYPDYFGQSIFLTYGLSKEIFDGCTLATGELDTICLVETKGKLISGWVNVVGGGDSWDYSIHLKADDTVFYAYTYGRTNDYYLWNTKNLIVRVVYWDSDADILTLELQGEITFSNNLSILVTNDDVEDIVVNALLDYVEVVQ